MRFVRVAAAATSLLVFGAAASIGSAGAATPGAGTSKASTTVLGVSLGKDGALLGVRVLGDDAQSTIDSKVEAFTKLTGASATSSVLKGLDGNPLNLTVGTRETRQPGGSAKETVSSLDLANPGVPVVTGLSDIVSGNLNLATLTSEATGGAAKSTLTGALTNLNVAGALVNAQSVATNLSSSSSSTESTSTRSVEVDAITVLDLGALLDGLEINVLDLTPAAVSALLDELGVAVPGIDPETTLAEQITAVNAAIDGVQDSVDDLTGVVDGVAGDLVDDLGLGDVVGQDQIDAVDGVTTGAVNQARALVDMLQAALGEVVVDALEALDGVALLKLEGVEVGVTTKAADTEAASAATVTGKVGAITVGNIEIPGVDLLQTAAKVNETVASVESTISGVLGNVTGGAIDLSSLVDVAVLQKTEPTVKTVNGYVTAAGGITGVKATITPPAGLDILVTSIAAQTPAGTSTSALLATLGTTVPQLSQTMSELEATLGAGTEALAAGGGVSVVEVMGESTFRPQVAPTGTGGPGTSGPLAETGANSLRLAGLGFLLVALGLGAGRWFRMPVPAWVRRRF